MKKIWMSAAALFLAGTAFAQVKEISLTGAPTVNYTWWDNNSAIENGLMVGGQLGFGFGRGVELRGIYQRSLDLKSNLSRLTQEESLLSKFSSREVTVTQWGGEFKANIPAGGWLAPYLTLGTGVQNLKTKEVSQDQIYVSGGLGLKFNLSDRITFNVEGKASAFNLDPSSTLYSMEENPNVVDEWINKNVSSKRLINLSVLAGIQFYLGGQTPEQMNAIERAYQRAFGGGLRGFKFVLEPGLSYINFDQNTNLRDTYLVGGSAGFDFTEFVGIRGFYYQTVTDKNFKSFDKASLYGADFIARLNVARGVVPYLTVGGGYLNVYDGYVGEDGLTGAKSGYFAKGGLGLTIPVGRYVEVFGAANVLLNTSADKANDVLAIKSADQLRTSHMFNAGLRIKLGSSVKAGKQVDDLVNDRVSAGLAASNEKLLEKERRIAELEEELKQAYQNNDAKKVVEIIAKKQEVEKAAATTTTTEKPASSLVRLTPEELQDLVSRVVNEVDKTVKKETTEERLNRLEQWLTPAVSPAQLQVPQNETLNQQILEELKKLNQRVQENSNSIEKIQTSTPVKETVVQVHPIENEITAVAEGIAIPHRAQIFFHKEYAVYAGASFGQVSTGVIGVRSHYGFSKTSLEFVPDVLFGFSGKRVFGLNANVVLPFNVSWKKAHIVTPYIGTGLGLNKFGDKFQFGPNIIIGTSFDVLKGKLFVDYTSRNLFNNNQLALGYRFSF